MPSASHFGRSAASYVASEATAVATQHKQHQADEEHPQQSLLIPEASLHAIFNSISFMEDAQQPWREHLQALELKLQACLVSRTADMEAAGELQAVREHQLQSAQTLNLRHRTDSTSCTLEAHGSAESGGWTLECVVATDFMRLLQLIDAQPTTFGKQRQKKEDPHAREASGAVGLNSCGNGSSHTAFYQAADGQPVFLHPFYYQLLLHEADAWLSSETLQHFEVCVKPPTQNSVEAVFDLDGCMGVKVCILLSAMAEEQQAPEDLSAFPSLPGVTTPVARATAGATRGTTTAPENAASAGGGLSFAGVVAFPADFREATLEQRQQLHFPSLATAVSVAVVGPKPRRARAGAAGDGGNAKSSTSSRKKSGVYKVASLGEFLGATRASQNPTL
ncbi:zinc finger (c3hc4 ring finger) domain-containing protein [Cyclospora cayetanensis]|uniref:Zinc finger (C3hc4 ring finger) domain-containing protein n=1 Tax=Cyclospora cayetanensis TaxID=88456 RepID=A0A1D3D7S5_9EIME|nr:zinc finger (c3hc4 ring finger) domain-containing protein [Cyclospora cayetanensis]